MLSIEKNIASLSLSQKKEEDIKNRLFESPFRENTIEKMNSIISERKKNS